MIDQQVASRVAAYRGNPQALQQRYAMSQELIDLLALQKIKSEKEAAARDMQLKMAQQQAANGEAPATVAEQREKEVMDLTKQELVGQRADLLKQQQSERQQNLNRLMGGIANAPGAQTAAQPQAMAAGGIVAFAGDDPRVGSQVPEAEVAKILRKPPYARTPEENATLERAGIKLQRAKIPEDSAVRRADTALKEAGANMRTAMSGGTSKMSDEELAKQPSAGGALNERIMRMFGASQVQPPAPKPPPAPVVPDSDAAEKADRMTGSVEAGQVPPPPPPNQQQRQRPPGPPTAPAAPAPAAANQLSAMQGIMAGMPPAPAMNPAVQKAIEADVAVDPAARQLAEEKRIEDRLKLTPEQRAVFDKGIAERERMMAEQYDPERQRREALKKFLIGGGGRAYGELGAGATSAMGYEEAQRASRKKEFEDLQKAREGIVGLEREATKGGIEGGIKGLEAASKQRQVGMQAGASDLSSRTSAYSSQMSAINSVLDNQSRERVAAMNAKVQREVAAATREQTSELRKQQLLNDVSRVENQTIDSINRSAQARALQSMLSLKAMNPEAFNKDKAKRAELEKLENDIELAITTARKQADERRAAIGGGGASGYKVERE
jgi:hypothetical protein